jgi:hypothetical protein
MDADHRAGYELCFAYGSNMLSGRLMKPDKIEAEALVAEYLESRGRVSSKPTG